MISENSKFKTDAFPAWQKKKRTKSSIGTKQWKNCAVEKNVYEDGRYARIINLNNATGRYC